VARTEEEEEEEEEEGGSTHLEKYFRTLSFGFPSFFVGLLQINTLFF
jgi:hypothetical protein